LAALRDGGDGRAATRLNNDAVAGVSQDPHHGKVEILYRTARAWNDSIDTSRPHYVTLARRARDWQPDW